MCISSIDEVAKSWCQINSRYFYFLLLFVSDCTVSAVQSRQKKWGDPLFSSIHYCHFNQLTVCNWLNQVTLLRGAECITPLRVIVLPYVLKPVTGVMTSQVTGITISCGWTQHDHGYLMGTTIFSETLPKIVSWPKPNYRWDFGCKHGL